MQLVNAPARTALPPLYEVESDLIAFFDQEDSVTPELEAEFRADLAKQMALAVKKRDSVAAFITECEARATFAAEEIKRLQRRKHVFTAWADRLRAYVCSIIEQLPPDAKGKPAKLNGERFSMSVRAVPASLEITDAEAVPLTYKTVTVTMPAVAYEVVKATLALLPPVPPTPADAFDFAKLPAHYSIDNAAVKAVLQAGREIPGADLKIGAFTLVVK
jgi:hypothetical protein